jgi:hypothetical protein
MKSIEQDLYDMIARVLNEEDAKFFHTRPRNPVEFPFTHIGLSQLQFTGVKGHALEDSADVVGQISIDVEVWGDGDSRLEVSLISQTVYNKLIRTPLVGDTYVYVGNLTASTSTMNEESLEDLTIWGNTITLVFNFSKA